MAADNHICKYIERAKFHWSKLAQFGAHKQYVCVWVSYAYLATGEKLGKFDSRPEARRPIHPQKWIYYALFDVHGRIVADKRWNNIRKLMFMQHGQQQQQQQPNTI